MSYASPLIRRQNICLLMFVASLLSGGCNEPLLNFVANTQINKDGSVDRSIVISSRANPNQPAKKVKIQDYLNLPEQKYYDTFARTRERIAFSGHFTKVKNVPVDFMKKTPGIDLWAQNQLIFRKRDYALLTVYEFKERIDDIIEQAEVDDSINQSIKLLIEAIIGGLEKQFANDYELKKLNSYLREVLPILAKRLYQIFWEIKRSRKGDLEQINTKEEWKYRLSQELSRYGIYLQPAHTKAERKSNEKRFWKFIEGKLSDLVKKKRDDVENLNVNYFRKRDNQIKLLFLTIKYIQGSYGSVEDFMRQLDIPLVVGAFSLVTVPFKFSGNNLQLSRPEPMLRFFFRARLPGNVIHTNAVQDLDGSLLWRFNGSDAMFTGYNMWARTLAVNKQAVAALRLNNFPGTLSAVERFYETLSDKTGKPNLGLIKVLHQCIKEKNLSSLRKAALPETPGLSASAPEISGTEEAVNIVRPQAAQRLLGVLSVFRQKHQQSRSQEKTHKKPGRSAAAKIKKVIDNKKQSEIKIEIKKRETKSRQEQLPELD